MPKILTRLKGLDRRFALMPPEKPKLLKDLLADTGGLSAIVRRAAATDQLARCVQSALPLEVSEHVLGANLRGDRLVVIVDGAAWAARVRFESASIRRVLEDTREIDVRRVTVQVRPPVTGP